MQMKPYALAGGMMNKTQGIWFSIVGLALGMFFLTINSMILKDRIKDLESQQAHTVAWTQKIIDMYVDHEHYDTEAKP